MKTDWFIGKLNLMENCTDVFIRIFFSSLLSCKNDYENWNDGIKKWAGNYINSLKLCTVNSIWVL